MSAAVDKAGLSAGIVHLGRRRGDARTRTRGRGQIGHPGRQRVQREKDQIKDDADAQEPAALRDEALEALEDAILTSVERLDDGGHAEARLWAADGRLVAVSRQTITVFA